METVQEQSRERKGLSLHYAAEPRTARLGASEVAAVLGLSPWQTPFSVWAHKVGLPGADDDDGPRRIGRYMERGVLAWLRDDTGAVELVEAGGYDTPWVVASRGRWPYIGCHPDGYLLHAGEFAPGSWWAGAEAKTASRSWDDVPPGYWLQCQVGMALTGLPAWDLGVLWTVAREFRHYRLDPDDAVTREALDRASAWWERHVAREEPPEVDASEDARRWLLSQFPAARLSMREATDAEAALARDVARLRAEIREREREEREVSNRLAAAIGDHDGLTLPDGKATWREQTSKRVDVARLREARPEVAEEYMTETATRVLRVALKGD